MAGPHEPEEPLVPEDGGIWEPTEDPEGGPPQ
jgi:hypothetical protein